MATQPRVPLATLPTPLQEAKHLSRLLGGPRIFLKRDDMTGMAFGGNKSRNLEFRMVEPLRAKAEVLIMALELTSNSARQTVAAANRLGMRTVLVLKGEPPPEPQGNLLVNELLGAEIHYVPDREAQKRVIDEVVDRVRREGRRPMVLTSEPIFDIGSALAYLESTVEMLEQMDALGAYPDFVYMTSGGKGQAGLVLAKRLLEAPFLVHGVTVSYEYDVPPRTAQIANDTLALLGLDVRIDPAEVISFGDHVGPGYGHVTEASLDAMALMARTEGVVLDPIYTGKTFAALLDHINEGIVPRDATVVFVHTGGTPAIFSHAETIRRHAATYHLPPPRNGTK
ncbi:MAG: pyridoxal-phosphate dependent enzyme [Trueperaceae bacterium]|nr:pyridoxal-phosphate dependent enzyme [Trueperaceae bacterium]